MKKSLSEQQYHKSGAMCEKFGAILLVLVGVTAGRQSDEIWLEDLKNFENLY